MHAVPRGHRLARQACCAASRKGGAAPEDVDLLLNIADNMMGNTICALADAAAMPVRAFVTKFRAEFEEHVAPRPLPVRAPRRRRGGSRRHAHA